MDKTLKHLCGLAFLAILAGAAPAVTVPDAFVYRGSLSKTDNSRFAADEAHNVTFALYAVGGSAPLWSATAPVRVSTNGQFQIELSDALPGVSAGNKTSLASILAAGSAATIGIAVDGETELYPRQSFVTIPMAVRAKTAAGLDAAASAGAVRSGNVTTKTASLQDCRVTSSMAVTGSSAQTLTVADWTVPEGSTLTLSTPGNTSESYPFKVFRGGAPDQGSCRDPNTGTWLLNPGNTGSAVIKSENKNGGILVIVSRDTWVAPCVSLPIGAGAGLQFPFSLSGNVDVYFYPFGN